MPAEQLQIAVCNLQTFACDRHAPLLGTSVCSAQSPARGQMCIDTIRNSTGTYNWRQLSTFNKVKATTDTPHLKTVPSALLGQQSLHTSRLASNDCAKHFDQGHS